MIDNSNLLHLDLVNETPLQQAVKQTEGSQAIPEHALDVIRAYLKDLSVHNPQQKQQQESQDHESQDSLQKVAAEKPQYKSLEKALFPNSSLMDEKPDLTTAQQIVLDKVVKVFEKLGKEKLNQIKNNSTEPTNASLLETIGHYLNKLIRGLTGGYVGNEFSTVEAKEAIKNNLNAAAESNTRFAQVVKTETEKAQAALEDGNRNKRMTKIMNGRLSQDGQGFRADQVLLKPQSYGLRGNDGEHAVPSLIPVHPTEFGMHPGRPEFFHQFGQNDGERSPNHLMRRVGGEEELYQLQQDGGGRSPSFGEQQRLRSNSQGSSHGRGGSVGSD